MRKALVLVLENSETNLGAGTAYRNEEFKAKHEPLEEEVIRCLDGWNKCMEYSEEDIDIFVVCPSKRLPRNKTVKAIKERGARYIETFLPETENFTCGYWNVPLAMSWFEKKFDYDIIIHIDLDMTMFRIPRPDMFRLDEGLDARVGILTDNEMKDVHIGQFIQHHETNFMVARRGFYTDWWEKTKELSTQYDPEWECYAELEEFAIDLMWDSTHAIEPEKNYQIGLRYPVSDINDNDLWNVTFIHAHPYEDTTEMWKEWLIRYGKEAFKNSVQYKD
jgi:hypothetical protein